MEKTVGSFFAAYESDLPESVADGVIRRLAFSRDRTSLAIEVDFSHLVPFDDVKAFADVLKRRLSLREVYAVPKYPSSLFSAEALPSVVSELKKRVPVNGFLDNAGFEISDGELKIDLKNGGESLLRKAGMEEALAKIIYSHFGLKMNITLSGNLSVDSAATKCLKSSLRRHRLRAPPISRARALPSRPR